MITWQTQPDQATATYFDGSLTIRMLLSAIPSTDTILPYVPSPEEMKAEAIASIDAQLVALDIKRIRPTAEGDTVYLAKLNEQAVALRSQRSAL